MPSNLDIYKKLHTSKYISFFSNFKQTESRTWEPSEKTGYPKKHPNPQAVARGVPLHGSHGYGAERQCQCCAEASVWEAQGMAAVFGLNSESVNF